MTKQDKMASRLVSMGCPADGISARPARRQRPEQTQPTQKALSKKKGPSRLVDRTQKKQPPMTTTNAAGALLTEDDELSRFWLAQFCSNTTAVSTAEFIESFHCHFRPKHSDDTAHRLDALSRQLARGSDSHGRISLAHVRAVSKGAVMAMLGRSDLAPSKTSGAGGVKSWQTIQRASSPKHSVIHPLQMSALRSAAVHADTQFSGAPWHSVVISHSASKRVPCLFSVEERRNSALDESSAIIIQSIVRGFLARRQYCQARAGLQ
jgi:hypothetical protein